VDDYGRRHYSPKGVKGHSPHSVFVSRPRERRTAGAGRQLRSAASIYLLLSAALEQSGCGPHTHTHTLRREPGRRKAVDGQMRVMGFFGVVYHTRRFSASALLCFSIPDATMCQSFSRCLRFFRAARRSFAEEQRCLLMLTTQ